MSDWFEEGRSGGAVDVAALFDSGAAPALFEVVAAGALVSVGRTSDGGAVGVTVTLDGRWRREYFRDPDELTDWLLGAREFVAAEAERLDASSARRKRARGARGG